MQTNHNAESLLKSSEESNDRARIDFVFAELTVATASCKIARIRCRLGLDPTTELKQAEGALLTAGESMQNLQTTSVDLQHMKALTEGLRTEFDALHNDLHKK